MRLCCYRRVLQAHWGGSAVSKEYYRNIREAELEQQSTTGALGMLRWYGSVLQKHWREAVLVQKSTIEYWKGCVGTAGYYRNIRQRNIGALERLCWYSRVL